MNKVQGTQQLDTHKQQVELVFALQLLDQAQLTWLHHLQMHKWILCQWLQSLAKLHQVQSEQMPSKKQIFAA